VTLGPFVVAGTLFAAIVSLFLTQKLAAYRDKPGATWLAVTVGSQTALCTAYGVALLVFDQTLRLALEVVVWVGLSGLPLSFLTFALAYSGRSHVVQSRAYRAQFLLPVGSIVLAATNPLHHLVWTGFSLDPVLGLATVSYTLTPVGSTLFVLGLLTSGLGAVVLLETAVSYSLYRAEAVAIAVSAVPPLFAALLWFLNVGPYPQLNLMPLFFVPHVAADAYAVFGTDIFEYNPTTRRVIDATAIDHLDSPLVVVNENRRVVNLNAAASEIFGVSEQEALKTDLDDLVGTPVDLAATDATVTVRADGETRHFAVSPAEQTDRDGTRLGHNVIFQDITAQRRREQRLDVLNRVLRHNLRNDLNVVVGNVQLVREDPALSTDGGCDDRLATAERCAMELLALAEDARTIDRVVDRADTTRETISLRAVIEEAVADAEFERRGGDVAVDVPDGVTVETDPELFCTMVMRLVATVADHTDAGLTVRLDDRDGSDGLALELHAASPLPEHEVAAIRAGSETPLEHASGLDLWVVQWGVDVLGYELTFGDDPVATLRLVE
jgi:PAS domain S-box-containing protein